VAEAVAEPALEQPTGPDVIDQVAIARLYGEPLFKLPQDLYIPPDALEVFLEAFEGPLDLLLYLIRRQHFNVLDIPMADVTRQYLEYVEQIRRRNLELAAEYLLMAAMLIEIKSRMLLPPRKSEDGREPEDPRAELVRRLLEYEQMKLAAARLDQLPLLGRDFLRAQVAVEQNLQLRFPDVQADELRAAWSDILQRARLVQHHRVGRQQLSVREQMSHLLKSLQGRRFVEFQELFEPERGVQVVVVTLIALLELSREHLVEITQAEAYAPMYVRLAYTPS
jgi:segregation and condensation protein A